MDACMDVWMHEWMHGWVGGWINYWADEMMFAIASLLLRSLSSFHRWPLSSCLAPTEKFQGLPFPRAIPTKISVCDISRNQKWSRMKRPHRPSLSARVFGVPSGKPNIKTMSFGSSRAVRTIRQALTHTWMESTKEPSPGR